MPTPLAANIKSLRDKGFSYREIKSQLNCSSSTISYYLSIDGKRKLNLRQKARRTKCHPFKRKTEAFLYRKLNTNKNGNNTLPNEKLIYAKIQSFSRDRTTKMYNPMTFTLEDVINKFGPNPVCYLTGEPIDINKPRTYNFDHIIPVSRGGDNSLNNLQICTKKANHAKSDMTPDELISFCKQVLRHNNQIL